MIQIDKKLIDDLFEKARASERLRMNYDLRTSSEDNSQRMLNALLPRTVVPVHRHPMSTENVFCSVASWWKFSMMSMAMRRNALCWILRSATSDV